MSPSTYLSPATLTSATSEVAPDDGSVIDRDTLHEQVAARLGVLPNFFCTAASAPGLIERLWEFARSAYFDSPLPSLFKERLFVHLSRFCEVRYCIVRHVGFLVGNGYPAGDRNCPPQSIDQVAAMLKRPVPSETEFVQAMERLQSEMPASEMPATGTPRETDLFDALTLIFLEPRRSAPVRRAVGQAFGEANLEMLTAFLAFVRTAHFWTETHPELEIEADMLALMQEHADLEHLLLDQADAERTWSPMERARLLSAQAAQEAHKSLVLRLLTAHRETNDASRIRAASAEAVGRYLDASIAFFVPATGRSQAVLDGRWPQGGNPSAELVAYCVSALRKRGALAIADTSAELLTAEFAKHGLRAMLGAPVARGGIVKGGFVVGYSNVRPWTNGEIALVQEVADRTWDAVERVEAEAALREREDKARVEALQQSQTRAAAYFNFSDDYLFLVRIGADGIARFEDMNPACERAMELVQAEIVGQPVEGLVPADSAAAILKYGHLCLETRQPQMYLATREYQEGRKLVIEAHVAFVERFADGGGLVLFDGQDVTEQRQIEEALRQAQKMEAVGQLTGGLAHDFNNLLAGISGSLELMQLRVQQGRFNDVDRYMAAAQGAARRAAALTHRLLAFSRRQTLDPKPTNVDQLVTGMQELIQRTVGPGIPVEVVGASGLWPALVDPPQLENALLNLCINARDAMPDGGRITVETHNKWIDAHASSGLEMPEGQYLSLCVTDTGTGMSPEFIARVFEPFFTTKPIGEGTGLGLSMIYGFAQQSGGQVRIYSEVGEGSTVCIYLPRHYGEVGDETVAAKPDARPQAERCATVLIVDDEPTVRMLVTDILEDLGYLAIEAGDSAAGLKILQSDVPINLLVTDVGLPGGMNGRQMADAGRVKRPDLKVLFITGYAENAVLSNGHLAPGMAVLTKPFAIDAMTARIRSMIEAPRVEASAS